MSWQEERTSESGLRGITAPDLAHLRPTATLEMLDRAFALLRARPGVFAVLAALQSLPTLMYGILLVMHGPILDRQAERAQQTQLFWLAVPLLLAQWANAAVIASAFQTLLFPRRPLSLWLSLRGSLGRLFVLLLTKLLVFVLLAMILTLAYFLLQTAAMGGGTLVPVFAALWLCGLALYLAIAWALVPVVVMIERRAFVRAIARSMDLMRTRFQRNLFGDSAVRRLLALAVLPAVVFMLITLATESFSVYMVGVTTLLDHVMNPWVNLVKAVGSLVISFVMALWPYLGLVLLYSECRMRREALDIQVRLLARGETSVTESNLTASY